MGVKVVVRADVAAANLFTAKINFNKDLLAVDSIDYTNTLVKNWVEQFSDNVTGDISLVGGVPSPGFQTASGGAAAPMAVIYFRALKVGTATISFTDASAIYSNADNINILVSKEPITLSLNLTGDIPIPPPPDPESFPVDGLISSPAPTTIPSPTPSPIPVATPIPGSGDANNNGKIDLIDLSILLSDFNKTSGFRRGIDLNGDGKINTFDFSLMRNLLIQKGVIRG